MLPMCASSRTAVTGGVRVAFMVMAQLLGRRHDVRKAQADIRPGLALPRMGDRLIVRRSGWFRISPAKASETPPARLVGPSFNRVSFCSQRHQQRQSERAEQLRAALEP